MWRFAKILSNRLDYLEASMEQKPGQDVFEMGALRCNDEAEETSGVSIANLAS